MADFSFKITSTLNAPKSVVWDYVTQMKNVNTELMPLVYMTYPKSRAAIADNTVPLAQTLFKSIVLLFGFIPVDVHCLRFERIDYGTAFYENSVTATHRYWKHTRTLSETNGITTLTDELHFLPRLKPMGYLLLPFIKKVFKNRHSKLNQQFN